MGTYGGYQAKAYVILIPLLLGGCASAKQIEAQQDAKCRSFGAQPGSDAYINCRTQLDAAATNAAAVRASGTDCVTTGSRSFTCF